MSGQEHTAECRERFEDAMTRVKATRVRQAERINRTSNNPGVADPSSSSGSGQHKRVRLADQERLDPIPERDTEMRTGSQEAPETRKRSAETVAERLEEEATSAEADSVRRLALKRKAEGGLDDSGNTDVEDSVHREKKLTCSFCNNVTTTLQARMPETLFPFDECGWDYIDDTSGKLLDNTLVEKARVEDISVIREVSGRWYRKPVTRLCLAHSGSTSTKEARQNRSTAVVRSCKSTNVQQTGHSSRPLLRSRHCVVC